MIIRLGVKLSALASPNRFISLITRLAVIGITLGVATLLTVIAVMRGFENEIRHSLVSDFDHLHVYSMFEHYPKALYDEINHIDGVKSVTGYQQTYGLIKTIGDFVPVMLIAFEESNKSIEGVIDGSIYLSGHHQLEYESGDIISIITPNKNASVQHTNLQYVSDLSSFDIKARGVMTAVVSQKTYQGMTGSSQLSGLTVALHDLYASVGVKSYLKNVYGGMYQSFDWRDKFQPFFSALRIQQTLMVFILSMITLVAMFGLVSGLVMLSSERREDIALLKTMGASRSDILKIFLVQGAIICGIGVMCGVLLAVMLCYFAQDIAGLIELLVGSPLIDERVYGTSTLPTDLDVMLILWVGLMTMTVGLIACSYPARQAAKIQPAEVLRYG
jgi:lipoprotein-releasing system permease protein